MSKNPFTMKALGEWDKDIGASLNTALKVAIETTKKTGMEAVARCIVKMAQIVRRMTSTAKKNRPIGKDSEHGDYIECYNQAGKITRLFKWQFDPQQIYTSKSPMGATWEQAKKIGNSGMAQRSWFWGLRGLPGATLVGKPYPGIAKLMTLRGRGENTFGMILENRLSYITKTVPADYEAQAVKGAGNQIMGEAARKMERDYQRQLRSDVRAVAGGLRRLAA